MNIILGILAAIFGGGFLFFRQKASNAESLNVNEQTIRTVDEKLGQITADTTLLADEQQKRETVQNDINKKSEGNLNEQDLTKYFNDRNNK